MPKSNYLAPMKENKLLVNVIIGGFMGAISGIITGLLLGLVIWVLLQLVAITAAEPLTNAPASGLAMLGMGFGAVIGAVFGSIVGLKQK